MKRSTLQRLCGMKVLGIILLALALPASAEEVGTVAAVEGTAEIGRQGIWTPAENGAAVAVGDELRTGSPGHLRVVFQDDTLLTLSADSHVTVDRQVFDPAAGQRQSLLGLLQGKVAAVVSEYYRGAGTRYEIKTATAVAGVRGTEFTVSYDPSTALTEVVGISGVVSVHSAVDPNGPGVLVTANETTTVEAGELPKAPWILEQTILRKQLRDIEFIGVGQLESLSGSHPLVAGSGVPQPDRAALVVAVSGGPASAGAPGPVLVQARDASSLIGQPPAVVKVVTGSVDIDVGRPH